jgi:hypothetical protein
LSGQKAETVSLQSPLLKRKAFIIAELLFSVFQKPKAAVEA